MSISNYPYESGEYWYLSTDVTVKRNQNIERIIIHFYEGSSCHLQIIFKASSAERGILGNGIVHDGVIVRGDTYEELTEYKSRLEVLLQGRPKRRFFRNWRVIK